ncbi:hypothetical protein [Marinicrinis sediminis]
MRLADMLVYSDIQQLNLIADSYQCDCKSNSKHELIQHILTAFGRREHFENMVSRLELADLRLINALMFDRKKAFSMEELTARASQSLFDEEKDKRKPRDKILRLKRLGFLFNGFSHQTKYLFSIPDDIKSRLSDVLKSHYASRLVHADAPLVYREEIELLQEDVLRLLRWVQTSRIPLTAERFMYKRHIQQALSELSVEEPLVAKGEWRFGYGRRMKEYPNRFSFLYDYCFYEHDLSEGEELVLTEKGEQRLLEGHQPGAAQLYRFYLKLYKHPIKNLEVIVHWILQLSAQWVSVHSLKQILLPYVKPFYYDTPERIIDQRIIQMLMHLGMLRIGEDPEYGMVIRRTAISQQIAEGVSIKEDEQIRMDPSSSMP